MIDATEPNATADIQRIGNAMGRTEEGLNQLNSMQSAKHDIYLNIDKESKPAGKLGNTEKTFTWDAKTKTAEVSKAVVTIYLAKLEEFANAINAGGQATGEQAKMYGQLSNDVNGMIAADAAHEAVHASDPTNIKQSIENQKLGTNHDLESKPEQVENRVLQQLIDKKQ